MPGYRVSRFSLTHGSRERALLPQSKAQEILAWACRISPQPVLSYTCTQVPQSLGVTHLGFRSYPTGLSIPESITTTFSFFRSDKPVYITASLRPISPCQPTQEMARPVIYYLWNPHPTFPGRVHYFYGRLYMYPGLGAPTWGIPRFRVLDPFGPQAPHQHF